MASKYLGPPGGKRRRRLLLLLPAAAIAALVLGLTGASATISSDSGFEGGDGNLIVNTAGQVDWNTFSPVTYVGTAPYQQGDKTVSGWAFTGLTDAQATTSDTAFAGGTKQDDNCATVGTGKASNKDDLKRIYLAHATVNGKIYLALAWVRIPQNTTSPSAHVAFEFNQGTTACPGTGHDGLVQRTAGDLLFVYDFEGGTTDNPTITVRKWTTTASDPCEVGADSPPCWGVAKNLTAFGFADAKVNTTAPVLDKAGPNANPGETLGVNEFGETVIDLTGAGIFSNTQCTSFGQVEGVSRSSGNSGTAQMKDLVGPGHIRISNCGTLKVKKITDPSPDPTDTSFSFSKDGSNNPTTLPATFSLKNGETDTETVFAANDFSVTETVPANWELTSASCDNGSGTTDLTTGTISGISVAADETVTCTFNDKLLEGAISIHKTDTKGNDVAGAKFTATASDGTTVYNFPDTDASGNACVENLPFDTYTVAETAAPPGYTKDTSTQQVTVNSAGTCASGATPAANDFVDVPLSDIQVNFRDGGSGKTSATSITCDNTTGTGSDTPATGWDASHTVTGVEVDPSPLTIHCTITIDP